MKDLLTPGYDELCAEGEPLIDCITPRLFPTLPPLKEESLPSASTICHAKSNDFQTDNLETSDSNISKNFDLGIYLEYWRRGRKNYVSPKYRNLREELTMNKYATITHQQFVKLQEKCERYLSLGLKANDIGRSNKLCNILAGMPISIEHLIALKLYTDFDDVQREFKRHCRRLHIGESVVTVIQRNREIAIWSRLLRECVMFWGKTMPKNEELYCGLTARLVLRSLTQPFECPLSTTKNFDIAQRFTDECNGAILRVKRANSRTRYFPASSITAQGNEEERLFFGSTIEIDGIFIFSGESGWEPLKPRHCVPALAMFQKIYNGYFTDGNHGARTLLLEWLNTAIERLAATSTLSSPLTY